VVAPKHNNRTSLTDKRAYSKGSLITGFGNLPRGSQTLERGCLACS